MTVLSHPELHHSTDTERIFSSWIYQEPGSRDLRLDFLRGFCIFAMVVHHIAGVSWLHLITQGEAFLVAEAEGFVLISGFLFGIMYRKSVEQHGVRAMVAKALARAWQVYLATIILTVVVSLTAWIAGVRLIGVDEVAHPLSFALRTLTFHHPLALAKVLKMFTCLMLGAPLGIWLMHRGKTWLLLAISWALWVAYQIAPSFFYQLLPLPAFHPVVWQIHFVHMMVIGYHRTWLEQQLGKQLLRVLYIGSILLFVILITEYLSNGRLITWLAGNNPMVFSYLFERDPVHPGRMVAAMIVFLNTYLFATYLWGPLKRFLGWFFLPIGQHSLYTYVVHSPLIVLALILVPNIHNTSPDQLMINTVLEIIALACVWAMIRWRILFSVIPQ